MKKITKILLMILMILPFYVSADMGAPELRSYKAVVINPDGVDYYGMPDTEESPKGHLDVDTVLDVVYESDDYINFRSNDNYGYIKVDGSVMPQEESVEPTASGITKQDKKMEALVYSKDGVTMYTGPSIAYKKVTTIPNNTKLTYEYTVGKGKGGSSLTYIYTEYNGKKGWISILKGKVLIKNTASYIFRREYKTENLGTISRNTLYKPEYKTDQWTGSILYSSNNKSELIHVFKSLDIITVLSESDVLTCSENVDMYEYSDNEGSKLLTISAGENMKRIAYVWDSYDNPDWSYYIEYNGKKGWIKIDHTKVTNSDGEIETPVEETEPEEVATSTETTGETGDVEDAIVIEKDESKSNNKLDPSDMVVICVVTGVAIALGAIATIVLVNRNKKNKKEQEVKTEETKEQE